jgi:hypothetical protein
MAGPSSRAPEEIEPVNVSGASAQRDADVHPLVAGDRPVVAGVDVGGTKVAALVVGPDRE